jgi:hypothetical protein
VDGPGSDSLMGGLLADLARLVGLDREISQINKIS